jgi:hypothetical protein
MKLLQIQTKSNKLIAILYLILLPLLSYTQSQEKTEDFVNVKIVNGRYKNKSIRPVDRRRYKRMNLINKHIVLCFFQEFNDTLRVFLNDSLVAKKFIVVDYSGQPEKQLIKFSYNSNFKKLNIKIQIPKSKGQLVFSTRYNRHYIFYIRYGVISKKNRYTECFFIDRSFDPMPFEILRRK